MNTSLCSIGSSLSAPVQSRNAVQRHSRFVVVRASSAGNNGALEEMLKFKESLNNKLVNTEAKAVEELKEQDAAQDDFQEVDIDTFWPVVNKESADKLVFIMCYTTTCKPCVAIKPMILYWKSQMPNVLFLKFQLNMRNKERGLELEVRSSPSFLMFRNGKEVGRIKGAKSLDALEEMLKANS